MGMTPSLRIYVGMYLASCALAVLLAVRERRTLSIFSGAYRQFLMAPWKLASFAVAASGMTWIAPYTGDHTWDYFDAALMSILTFASAPWAIGTIWLALRGKAKAAHAFVAFNCWMFSASWNYDLYILFRDGKYPVTWFPNIFASSALYICAGLMWNLEKHPGRGVIFAFMEEDWPRSASRTSFRSIFGYALPFMLVVAAAILYFVV